MLHVKILLLLVIVVMALAACGNAVAPPARGILDAPAQATTLTQVRQAIDTLYRRHPGITEFSVKNVTYTPAARDKVLKICSEGSVAADNQERERQKVLACAPLIFFFYNYGQQSAVPESVDVARLLYAYATTNSSADAAKVLTDLLRSWQIA
ncbi:MAG: hypothetical protein IPO81_01885 [Kouleothrix sp.]|nr:hypothetical protein [Kouleothrix sp.]